ncbi:MAG: hypothetical protein AABY22_28985 [Nanoarchaeota archaeon]
MNIFYPAIQYTNPGTDYQNTRCLVGLKQPVFLKTSKKYNYLIGNVVLGYFRSGASSGDTSQYFIRIGSDNNPNRIIIPIENVLSIQECEKILNNEEVFEINE